MAAAIGSDLPGQPSPYNVDDDVALLQPGNDATDQPILDPGKVHLPPINQPQPYGYAYPPAPAYYGQPASSMPAYMPHVDNHQQTTVVVTGQSQQPTVVFVPTESFSGKMAFACFVLWCCNPIFGLIAFFLAVHADNIKMADHDGAHRLGRASLWVSVTGIIVGVILSAVVTAVVIVKVKQQIDD